jgi:hypothetical protein
VEGYAFDWGLVVERHEEDVEHAEVVRYTSFGICPTMLFEEGWSVMDLSEVWEVWCSDLQDDFTMADIPIYLSDGEMFETIAFDVQGIAAEDLARAWMVSDFLPKMLPTLLSLSRDLKGKWDIGDESSDWADIRLRVEARGAAPRVPTA